MPKCFHEFGRIALSLSRCAIFAVTVFAVTTTAWPDQASLTTLRNETRRLLRHEATVPSGPAKDAAITALCDLYVILRSDHRYQDSKMMQSDAAKIRRRLIRLVTKRENDLKRRDVRRPDSLSSGVQAAIDAAMAGQTSLQRSQLDGGQGGAAAGDTGWELVELIQRIIAPDFWDRQGGPGAIRYFAIRRVLVVRATTDVHEQIKDLLTVLR